MFGKLKPPDVCRRLCGALWQTFMVLLYASWWGGLSFYAVVVVPIGTHQIGSVGQGFITQEVTYWHNLLLTAMVICLAIEALRRKAQSAWLIIGSLAIIDLALLADHSRLTSLMNFTSRSVPDNFYHQHAIYLWLTAAEWVIGLILPLWGCRRGLESTPAAGASNSTI